MPAPAQPVAADVRRGRGARAQLELLEPEEGEGGNEWVTHGPHMSLRYKPASYVAVNASVAWSKPLNVGQNSLVPAQVLKVNGFDSSGTDTRRFCS